MSVYGLENVKSGEPATVVPGGDGAATKHTLPSAVESKPSSAGHLQVVHPPDILQDAAHVIENIKSEDAALTMFHELTDDHGMNAFKRGGVLQKFREEHWYRGHKTFKELVENEFAITVRTAQYLISVYNLLLDAEIPWEQVQEVGWTKLRLLPGKVALEAVPGWLEKAKSMSARELGEAVRQSLVDGAGAQGGSGAPTTVLTFKPHPDQLEIIQLALARAKEVSGTTYDTVALYYACLEYVSGPPKPVKEKAAANYADKILVTRLNKLGLTEALIRVAELDPNADPEGLVITFLKETGVDNVRYLLGKAFPAWHVEATPAEPA